METKRLFEVIQYGIKFDKRNLFNKLVNLPPETPPQILKSMLKGGTRKSKMQKYRQLTKKRQKVTNL
jgi:hypothetical protein